MTYESEKEWILGDMPDVTDLNKYKKGNILRSLLYQRGISPEEAESFLNPSFEQIPDCTHLHDSNRAAERIIKASKEGEKIYIHGDFDADGICATSILWDFLFRELAEEIGKKVDVMPYIPDRASEGYGLSESSVGKIIKEKADLIVTVDCGVRDKDLIRKIDEEESIDFIVTDHHQPPEDILDGLGHILVHPMYPGKEYPEKEISGAFVALLLVQAIRKELDMSWEWEHIKSSFDLVALSTVADLMPLKGPNRAIVAIGLEQIKAGGRKGLDTLIELSGIERSEISTYHLGFVLGPRINAAGRIGNPLDGVRLFNTRNDLKAKQMAAKLNQLNKQRQQITEDLMKESLGQARPDQKILIIVGEEWPEGIVGLVAGKIMERFKKPTLVITKTRKEMKGSARSLGGFNITNALTELSDLLEKYGGHAEAAGFSIKEGELDTFIKKMRIVADREIEDQTSFGEYHIDMLIDLGEVTVKSVEEIAELAPFGMGNRKPIFMLDRSVVLDKRAIGSGKNHMSLVLKSGVNDIKAILFDCVEDIEKLHNDDIIEVAGYLELNRWQGRVDVQFMIKQWRFAG